MSRIRLALIGAAGVLACSVFPATASAVALETNRFAERPAGQYHIASTSSVMTQSHTWPAGTNAVSFDYFVDSEPNFDFLKVYVDNVLQWSASGLNKAGHADLGLSSGAHTIKFEYAKDGSVDRGLDTAWVDNVNFTTTAAAVAPLLERFDTTDSLSSRGWTPSGASGGWAVAAPKRDLSAGRPRGQVNANTTTSYMEKALTWSGAASPWYGAVDFDYAVDSEAGYDKLQVLVDGVIAWSMSGLHKVGHKVIPVAGSGSHTIRFQYAKDGSLSDGRDSARVDRVRFTNGDNTPLEVDAFDGRTVETAPIAVLGGITEWTSGGASGGWVVHGETPSVLYAPRQTTGQQINTRYKAFAAPTLDGVVNWKTEYVNPTRLSLFNLGDPDSTRGSLGLIAANNATNSLFVAIRAKAGTLAQGTESGQLTLYLDGSRPLTLNDVGTCSSPQLPGAEDRELSIVYTVGSGATAATATVTELKGACVAGAGAWVSLGSSAAWLSNAATKLKISEPTTDPGFIHLEMELSLPGAVITDGRLGMGFVRSNTAGAVSQERLPSNDFGGPIADDVSTWSTVELTMPTRTTGMEPTMLSVAKPDRAQLIRQR